MDGWLNREEKKDCAEKKNQKKTHRKQAEKKSEKKTHAAHTHFLSFLLF